MRHTTFAFVLSLMLAAASAAASTIAGTATDPSGAPVAGARITLHNLATGAEVAATADADPLLE